MTSFLSPVAMTKTGHYPAVKTKQQTYICIPYTCLLVEMHSQKTQTYFV